MSWKQSAARANPSGVPVRISTPPRNTTPEAKCLGAAKTELFRRIVEVRGESGLSRFLLLNAVQRGEYCVENGLLLEWDAMQTAFDEYADAVARRVRA